MAGHRALVAAGRSIVELLDRRVGEALAGAPRRPGVVLVGSHDLDKVNTSGAVIQYPSVSLYCYRVSVDRETRPGWSAVSGADGVPRLPLRMHLLVSAWDESVEYELEWLGLVAQMLETEPILTGPLLHPDGAWEPGDAIQVVADDLSVDTMSEAFQALLTKYRLCLPYLVRVIRISGRRDRAGGVVGTVGAALAGREPLP